jgi:hypothetical protein
MKRVDQSLLLIMHRKKTPEDIPSAGIFGSDPDLREALGRNGSQVIKPVIRNGNERLGARFEQSVRELVGPLDKYGITPEIIPADDVDFNSFNPFGLPSHDGSSVPDRAEAEQLPDLFPENQDTCTRE